MLHDCKLFAPFSEPNFPGGQPVQVFLSCAPAAVEYVPAVQLMQESMLSKASSLLHVPGGQLLQKGFPASF